MDDAAVCWAGGTNKTDCCTRGGRRSLHPNSSEAVHDVTQQTPRPLRSLGFYHSERGSVYTCTFYILHISSYLFTATRWPAVYKFILADGTCQNKTQSILHSDNNLLQSIHGPYMCATTFCDSSQLLQLFITSAVFGFEVVERNESEFNRQPDHERRVSLDSSQSKRTLYLRTLCKPTWHAWPPISGSLARPARCSCCGS